MSEGRTSAAEADVDGEDHPVDAPASTGTTGAADVTGSAGSNGHDADEATTTSGTTSTGTTASETAGSETAGSETAGSETASTTGSGSTAETSGSAAKAEEPADTTAAGETVPAATLPGDEAETTTTASPVEASPVEAAPAGDGEEEWADAEDKAYKKEMRKGFAFGAVGGILIGAIIALLLGALVWPGYLLGPGDPQDTANQVTQALSAKDAAQLDQLSCKGENGQSVTQLSPQVLQYITKVAPAGPTTTLIQTEARTPVDLTLSVQGQTQTLPSELVLGETKGNWCLKGLAQRQQ